MRRFSATARWTCSPRCAPDPPRSLHVSRETLDLARVGDGRRTREPDTPVFPPQTECERLREILPGYKAALALGSRHAVDALIRDAFRDAPSKSDVDTSNDVTKAAARLDDAVAAHALLRRRAALLEGMAAVAEGVNTTRSIHDLTEQRGIDMPIARAVYGLLFVGHSPIEATDSLMSRPPREE